MRYAPLRPVHGCAELTAHQADDSYAVWEAWEQENACECPIPFWAVVWPGAAALARYVLKNNVAVKDRLVLDLGCGGGIAGIASGRAGARAVIANDIDPIALYIAERNARANGVSLKTEDRDLTMLDDFEGADVILVADMFYIRDDADRLLCRLRAAQEKGGTVLISDGGRAFAPKSGIEILAAELISTNPDLEGTENRQVRILTLTR
ncbi:MAG: methyltransferase [Syntrophobacteraceae bacterium]